MIEQPVTDIYYSFLKSFEASRTDFPHVNPLPETGLVIDVSAGQEDAVALTGLKETDRTCAPFLILKIGFGSFSEEDKQHCSENLGHSFLQEVFSFQEEIDNPDEHATADGCEGCKLREERVIYRSFLDLSEDNAEKIGRDREQDRQMQ